MANTITVSPQALRKIADELQQYNESYKRQLQEMAAIKNSLNAKWEGTAKEAFNKKFEERATLFDAFYMAIKGYVSVLTAIADRYENVERKNIAIVNKKNLSFPSASLIFPKPSVMPTCTLMYGSPLEPKFILPDFVWKK